VKLAEVAELAGTSVATVSKVLNGRPGVSDSQRTRIARLLSDHGYRRRGTSVRSPARLIDVVVRGIDTQWSAKVLVGAEQEAATMGIGIVVTVTHGRTLGNRRWLSALAQRHTDGLVLVVSRLNQGMDAELARLGIPYVLVDPIGTANANVPVVGATNYAGGRVATEHLLGLGHRRVGVISGDPDLACSQERVDGYRAALGRAGIPVDPQLIRIGNFMTQGGHDRALELLRLPDPPTAIFAGSDMQALGVYQAAKELGLRIPDDLSVVGFDDVEMCRWLSPELTTVHQPIEEMAREATRILMSLAYRGVQPLRPKVEMATNLIVRESTAAPRGH